MLHDRTKYIDLRFHYIRDLVADGTLSLHHCNTSDRVADILTKALSGEKHAYLRSLLGVHPLQLRGSVDVIEEGHAGEAAESEETKACLSFS